MEQKFMEAAFKKAEDNVALGGGPFGAAIVKNGQVIALGNNRVTLTNDPTAHAEVTAIREACKTLNTFDLSGCEIYTSCEPCPMCLSAIYWARIEKIYYGNTKTDAKKIGFDDSFIYDEIEKSPADRAIPAVRFMPEEAIKAFKLWEGKGDKTRY